MGWFFFCERANFGGRISQHSDFQLNALQITLQRIDTGGLKARDFIQFLHGLLQVREQYLKLNESVGHGQR